MSADPQMRWLRLWTDILEDPKLLLLAPGDRWYYIGILRYRITPAGWCALAMLGFWVVVALLVARCA